MGGSALAVQIEREREIHFGGRVLVVYIERDIRFGGRKVAVYMEREIRCGSIHRERDPVWW